MLKRILGGAGVALMAGCSQTYMAGPTPHDTIAVTDTPTWVYSSTGARQCEPGSGISLLDSADQLREHNITVNSSKRGHLTGMFVIALCGAPTLDIYLHEIDTGQLSSAEALGFKAVNELESEDGAAYKLEP
ncbi:hypothetical protein EDC56_2745 [Sinobacterium caligoides]|uniref:Lipoprotein n=1 Tax=Sinobacterium caligoides TaxID=933926 RepID=A0A3N2DKA0_9GAMM|nr:hypothetical protein [Sinobacterium caligoides]ROS00109.1 hypothetical protein EDC56_2745 [Sinobacterium caligoides]